MRYNTKIKIKSKKTENKLPKMLKMPMRNVVINKARTIISVVSIAGCLLLFMIGSAVADSYYRSDRAINISSIKLFSGIFKIFAVVLLILFLIVLATQIFKERTKEMALLRLHGEDHMKIWLSLLFEMLFVVSLSSLISFVLLQPCLLILSKISAIGYIIIADFMCYFSAVLFVILGVSLIALACMPRVYKLSLVDVLKNEE
jgi:ABC-type antimicrobial peptide transport system permease subunit